MPQTLPAAALPSLAGLDEDDPARLALERAFLAADRANRDEAALDEARRDLAHALETGGDETDARSRVRRLSAALRASRKARGEASRALLAVAEEE